MRKITSLTLFISGIIELVTSVVLYILPSGRVAYWADYRLWGLSKTQWGNIHITVGTLMLLAAVLHIYYNWRLILSYLKNKAKELSLFTKTFTVAMLVTLYVTIGTLYNLPPMNYVLEVGVFFTDSANEKYGEPPYGHAELSSFKMFSSKMQLNLEKAQDLLLQAGIKVESDKKTISEIAKENSLSPQEFYNIIKPAGINTTGDSNAFPDSPPPGFGSKSISTICQTYKLSLENVLQALHESGFSAEKDDTVKEIGSSNNTNQMVIFEIIKKAAGLL
jgi:hypothetical protein